ncbi:MAG TPA: prolyl oligopeptidase family serine peptidase, partial [Gemmatimonadaceae bacterium]|nr:prolyl oligopeptidase family serine peptidase [Gemmatimonadaceae bacterium]
VFPAHAVAQDGNGGNGAAGAKDPSGADSAILASPQHAALALEGYGTPPAAIARLVDAPRHLNVTLDDPSPDRSRFLTLRSDGLPPVTAFAKPWYNLGGVQVDRQGNRARSMTLRGYARIELTDWKTGRTTTIEAPGGARVSDASWSPTGREVAFLAHYPDATHIYVADAATGRSRRLTKTPVLATMVTGFGWTADGKTIATVLLRDGHGAEPARPAVAPGPNVRLHFSGNEKNRTYASLLATPHEMALLEHFITGQLALVDVASGRVRKVGRPAMFRSVDVSPDGTLLRVTTVQKPFSYTVPVSNFGTLEELWDVNGRVVAEVARRPLREGQGDGPGAGGGAGGGDAPADTGRRNLAWSPDGKGLVYLQLAPAPARAGRDSAATTDSAVAQGAGRGGNAAARRRDRLVQWLPPYDASSARVLYESDARMGAVAFSDDGQVVFVNETQNGIAHTYAVFLKEPGKRHTITRGRGTGSLAVGRGGFGGGGGGGGANTPQARAQADSAFYGNPGTLTMRRGSAGVNVVVLSTDGEHVFLEGTRYGRDVMTEAPRPFVDRVAIRTGEKKRVFESAADVFEQVTAPLDDDFAQALVTRESPTMVPDSYVRDMTTGALRKLTSNRDVTPEVTAAQRRQVQVTRADGYKFWVEVTLPADWKPGTKLPAMFWFYPREYSDQYEYDRSRRTLNRNRVPGTSPRSMDFLTLAGYAVVEPDSPIFGPSGRMNDNYEADLRNNLAATIDELERQGYIDRQRLGVGGHSYGAFSTVNAMVHTPFFKAGIAGDGNYNRTLTPNGFQSERRDLWEARDTYIAMSPFFHAQKLTGALLMYHGLEDQNVGTAPENSPRLFHALQGLGKTTSLYMYPYEDHGPAARETLLDLWSRWVAWLDLYVMNADQGKTVM